MFLAKAADVDERTGNGHRAYARRVLIGFEQVWEVEAMASWIAARDLWRRAPWDAPIWKLRRCIWLGVHGAIDRSANFIEMRAEELPGEDMDAWVREFMGSIDDAELVGEYFASRL